MPLFFTVDNFKVLDALHQAVVEQNRMTLILAAMRLIGLNCVRAVPHYIATYLIADSIVFVRRGKQEWLLNCLLVVVILPMVYAGIDLIHGLHYDFGIPAILMMAVLVLFYKLNFRYVYLGKRVAFLASMLIAVQFFDLMPAAQNLPVGRGEISRDIKMAARVLDMEAMLNAVTFFGFLMFFLFGALVFLLLRDENNIKQLSALREQNQAIRTSAAIQEMENRTYQEMRALVHDLKGPLAAVQTLVGAIKMEMDMEGITRYDEYISHIEQANDQMSQMISEMLYEDKTVPERVQRIVNRTLAQISVEPYADSLHTDIRVPDALVQVNQLLFTRALVNLIQNAAKSIPPEQEKSILLQVTEKDGTVRFRVEDNGCGIPEDRRSDVWVPGYSGTNSSGLGLPFVRSVVERMGGSVELESAEGRGTAISLCLPLEEGTEDEHQ